MDHPSPDTPYIAGSLTPETARTITKDTPAETDRSGRYWAVEYIPRADGDRQARAVESQPVSVTFSLVTGAGI